MVYFEAMSENAQLALDTILQRPTEGIPSKTLFLMQHAIVERLAGAQPGDYRRDPAGVYLAMQRAVGTCLVDQWIPRNPLTMGDAGYEADSDRRGTATTGADGCTTPSGSTGPACYWATCCSTGCRWPTSPPASVAWRARCSSWRRSTCTTSSWTATSGG